jgi:hypothetical protein
MATFLLNQVLDQPEPESLVYNDGKAKLRYALSKHPDSRNDEDISEIKALMAAIQISNFLECEILSVFERSRYDKRSLQTSSIVNVRTKTTSSRAR